MTKLIAHRGLKIKDVKENSIEAIRLALQNDHYAGFECDVRTTKDKKFVIMHNPIKQNDMISLTTYKELKDKYHIPLLEDVLKLQSNKIFLLEIKEPNLDVDLFLNFLRSYQNKNIYLMSFHNSVIKKLAVSSRFYKLGVLNYVLNSEENYNDYDFICLLEAIVTPKLIKYFEAKKIETFLYGIHHFDSLVSMYPNSYFITDKIIDS